jgi:hypothetical protein
MLESNLRWLKLKLRLIVLAEKWSLVTTSVHGRLKKRSQTSSHGGGSVGSGSVGSGGAGAAFVRELNKGKRKMCFKILGTIIYKGDIQTIYVNTHVPPDESWAMTKARYFPDYDGPDPAKLSKYSKKPPDQVRVEKRDLF